MPARRLLAALCATAIGTTSIASIPTDANAQANQEYPCYRTNRDNVQLWKCEKRDCWVRDGRAVRVVRIDSSGSALVFHRVGGGWIEEKDIDPAAEAYCIAAGI